VKHSVLAAAIVLLAGARAQAAGSDPCGEDASCARSAALAYLETGNRVWAIKTLLEHLEASPDDLETLTWAAWLLMQEGSLDQAEKLLDEAEAPPGPLARRLELLGVVLSRLEGEDEEAATGLVDAQKGGGKLLPEDVALLSSLRSQLTGNEGGFLSARVILSGGYTTNATQSAPQEAGAGLAGTGAPILSLDLVLRLEPWVSTFARPLAEISTKGFMPLPDSTRDLSYLDLGGRAGIELGKAGGFRIRLLYSYEVLGILDRGWYMAAHRGEIELDIRPWLMAFAGAGRRVFEHLPRTRTEMDAGLSVVLDPSPGWNLTGLVAGRLQLARHEAFDDLGVTALVRARIPLPRDFMVKLLYMALYDAYPDSASYFNEDRFRQDLMLKAEAGVWSPSFHGLRIGASYFLAYRWSTVDSVVDNFNFMDHRFLLQLRWEGSLDPTLPRKAKVGKDHIPLPYGIAEGDDTGLDRVQDLLHQEDSARRGSMCVN